MIRPAEIEDIDRLVALGGLMHQESPRFSRMRYSPEKVQTMLYNMIGNQTGCALVAVKHDEIIGGILGVVYPHWFSEDLVAQDLALFVDPTKRGGIVAARLVRGFIDWAQQRKAKMIQLGITTGVHVEQTARLYSELGLSECGVLFEV